jgi:CBS domain-containing protein
VNREAGRSGNHEAAIEAARGAVARDVLPEARMKITQMMTTDVKTCRPSDTLDRAAQLMWDHDIGSLPVVDDSGQVVGMLTDRDACMAAYTQGQPLQRVPVSVAMTNHVVTCRPNDTDVAVARLMAKHKIRRIPVVDDDQKPIGIVSLNDLVLAMAKGREPPATEVSATLAAICEHRPSRPVAVA